MNARRTLSLLLIIAFAALMLLSVGALPAMASRAEIYGPPPDSDSFAAPQAGSLSATILNTDTYAAGPSFGEVVAFFDHNGSPEEVPFVGGHYVGARICSAGGTISDVVATISSSDIISPYNELTTTENVFMFGKGEVLTRSLGTINTGDCELAYYYVVTPRFNSGGAEIPKSPAEGMSAEFTISAEGMDDTLSPVSDEDTRNIYMAPSVDAQPNRILNITTINSKDYFTFVVDFDAGNVGSNEDATFNPTSYFAHNAAIFDLVGVEISNPDFGYHSTDVLRINIPDGSHVLGTITYTLKRMVEGANTEFYPIQHVNSGEVDKFNADVSQSQVPTAISLLQIHLVADERPGLLLIVVAILLFVSTIIVFIRQGFRNPN